MHFDKRDEGWTKVVLKPEGIMGGSAADFDPEYFAHSMSLFMTVAATKFAEYKTVSRLITVVV